MLLFIKVVNLIYDKGGLMGEWTKPLIILTIRADLLFITLPAI